MENEINIDRLFHELYNRVLTLEAIEIDISEVEFDYKDCWGMIYKYIYGVEANTALNSADYFGEKLFVLRERAFQNIRFINKYGLPDFLSEVEMIHNLNEEVEYYLSNLKHCCDELFMKLINSDKEITDTFNVKINMNVDLFCLLFRVLRDASYFSSDVKADLYRFIIHFFSSKGTDEISYESIRQRMEQPTYDNITAFKNVLEQLDAALAKIEPKRS